MQTQAYINQSLGMPGTISRKNPVVKLPMIAESDVLCGGFCFAGTDPEVQVKGLSSGATAVAGFVVTDFFQPALSGYSDSLAANNGSEVCVVKKGYCYAISTTAATKGQHVIVNPATGAIKTVSVTESAGTGAVTGTINVTQGTITGTVDGTSVSGDTVGVAAAFGTDAKADLGSVSGIDDGFIDTGWIVETGAGANEVCEICNI